MILFEKSFIQKATSSPKYTGTVVGSICNQLSDLSAFCDQLESWYKKVPSYKTKDIKKRFQSYNDRQHWSSFWEMAINSYFIENGFQTVWGKEGEPDLLLFANGNKIAVEIRGLYPSQKALKQKNVIKKLVDTINRINSPVALNILSMRQINEDIDIKEIVTQIKHWLESISFREKNVISELRIKQSNCDIRISVAPNIKPKNGSCVNLFPHFIESNREKYLRQQVLKKKSKYANNLLCKNIPLIIALGNSSQSSITQHTIDTALFGKNTITFDLKDPDNVKTGRDKSGFIVPKEAFGGPINTWLSGVLYFTIEWTGNLYKVATKLYCNHWARIPLPIRYFKCPVFHATCENNQFVTYKWI